MNSLQIQRRLVDARINRRMAGRDYEQSLAAMPIDQQFALQEMAKACEAFEAPNGVSDHL